MGPWFQNQDNKLLTCYNGFANFPYFFQNGPLAQLVEHLTFNQVVEGSIPSRLTFLFLKSTEHVPIV